HACCLICFIINDYAFKNLVSFPEILHDFNSHTTNPTKPTLGREQIRNTETCTNFYTFLDNLYKGFLFFALLTKSRPRRDRIRQGKYFLAEIDDKRPFT
ncbi:hypothetical protein TorRG33x02_012650, partial [Trema orientale]